MSLLERRAVMDPAAARHFSSQALPWIEVAPGAPFFRAETGEPWTPIGHNEAVSWINLAGLFRRGDPLAVERYFAGLRAFGVTCLRLMLEYSQDRHRYFERPAGVPVPAMVSLWDDLFALGERYGIRILLTPFDTFWMARRWRHHPYARERGGPLARLDRLLGTGEARRLIKARLEFVIRRWGGSGALFAWDFINEIDPSLDAGRADRLGEFVHDLSAHVRALERKLYGRSHPQTVSVFGPALGGAHGEALKEIAFRHPDLDFATSHFYETLSIDAPRDTVAPALAVGRLVAEALAEIRDDRPFFDSESGPIHSFNNRRRVLPLVFDEEYFRHMQWAHWASGGAGGGMRWPYRHPHRLTEGMHRAQGMLGEFCDEVDWRGFRRRPLGGRLSVGAGVAGFGCGDETKALVWLLRTDCLGPDGMLAPAASLQVVIGLAGLRPGRYEAVLLEPVTGRRTVLALQADNLGRLDVPLVLDRDLALVLRPAA